MMGVPPEQAQRLTYWQYTAMRAVWNERHRRPDGDDGSPVQPPDEDFVRQRQAELAELGISGTE
jgi:hypothetical protein